MQNRYVWSVCDRKIHKARLNACQRWCRRCKIRHRIQPRIELKSFTERFLPGYSSKLDGASRSKLAQFPPTYDSDSQTLLHQGPCHDDAQLDIHFCRSDCTHTKVPSHIRSFLRQNYRCITVYIDCSRCIAIIEDVAGMRPTFAPALSGPLDFVGRGGSFQTNAKPVA